MSGILSLGRELLAIYKPKGVPKRSLFWSCLFIAFIISSGILWCIEHQKVNDLSNKSKLILQVNQFFILEYSTINESTIKGSAVLVNVKVGNIGIPTIAEGWELSIKSDSININRLHPITIEDGYKIILEGKVTATFHKDNILYEKTMIPIQKGSYIAGWLMYVIENVTPDKITNADKTIYARDIFGTEYSVNFKKLDQELKGDSRPYYPGSGHDIFTEIPKTDKNAK